MTREQVLVLIGLGMGVALWIALGNGRGIGWCRGILATLTGCVAMLPPVARRLASALDLARAPSRRAASWTGVAVMIAASAYFIFTAHFQGRDLYPKTHDDQSYLIQMQMLARGQLWARQHELADFFETFYVNVRPRYASMYFHGAALLYVPTVWLGLPTWLMPTLVAGACVGLLYRIVAASVDGVAGLLAALLLAGSSWLRMYSVLLTSHEPMLLLGLLMIWAWLRWRASNPDHRDNSPSDPPVRPLQRAVDIASGDRSGPHATATAPDPAPQRNGWLLAIGVFAGWAAITRPLDAVVFALPIGLGLTFDLRRKPWRRWIVAGGLLVAGAAPLLALQGAANRGVTGDPFTSPFRLYLDASQPGTELGFRPYDPTLRPKTTLPQKRDYYDAFYVPLIKNHQPDTFLRTWAGKYLPMMADVAPPARPLLLFLPVGLLALLRPARHRPVLLAMASVLPLFVALYMSYAVFLEHYVILVIPAVSLLVLLGGRAVASAWPARERQLASAFAAGIAVLVVTLLPELNGLWDKRYAIEDETFPAHPRLKAFAENGEALLAPAVVLFRYHPNHRLWEEPVYNASVAWPDDAPVIRAHDLGPRNIEIFRYYAQRDPERMFYLYERRDPAPGEPVVPLLRPLGKARELVAPQPQ